VWVPRGINGRGAGADIGVLVHSSSNTEVYGNTVVNNNDGIGGIESGRGTGGYGPRQLKNLYVHDNTIILSSGQTGIVTNQNNDVFNLWNNRFENNNYQSYTTAPFRWVGDSPLTWEQWQTAGRDLTGTYK
jgi:hypothetical protein